MTTRLTVIIPCKDELPNIDACINSVVGLADELIVADSGSTDGTLRAKVGQRCQEPFIGASQGNRPLTVPAPFSCHLFLPLKLKRKIAEA